MSTIKFPSKIVLATHNQGKVFEFQKMFEPFDIKIIGAGDAGVPEPIETEDTFEGNALLKARHACDITAMTCLADDSGLCVEALNDAPGIYSARWAGESKDFKMAMRRIQNELGESNNMNAKFVAVLALVMPDEQEFVSRGEVNGRLTFPPRGLDGFGYDPIFMPEDETQTFAEMGYAGKEKYSHRHRAFLGLMEILS
jgi:XTP/dITP diphosphohydrolase